MPNTTANRLLGNIDKILSTWEERVKQEVSAAYYQDSLALRNPLLEFLVHLVDALSTTIDRTAARKRSDKLESIRIGKRYGENRAGSRNYSIDQLITEYHILRQILFDVMEE